LKKASGKLLKAPFSIVENIKEICKKYNANTASFGEEKITPHQLIIINNQFVIAEIQFN
jgi:hypothetical protein